MGLNRFKCTLQWSGCYSSLFSVTRSMQNPDVHYAILNIHVFQKELDLQDAFCVFEKKKCEHELFSMVETHLFAYNVSPDKTPLERRHTIWGDNLQFQVTVPRNLGFQNIASFIFLSVCPFPKGIYLIPASCPFFRPHYSKLPTESEQYISVIKFLVLPSRLFLFFLSPRG